MVAIYTHFLFLPIPSQCQKWWKVLYIKKQSRPTWLHPLTELMLSLETLTANNQWCKVTSAVVRKAGAARRMGQSTGPRQWWQRWGWGNRQSLGHGVWERPGGEKEPSVLGTLHTAQVAWRWWLVWRKWEWMIMIRDESREICRNLIVMSFSEPRLEVWKLFWGQWGATEEFSAEG